MSCCQLEKDKMGAIIRIPWSDRELFSSLQPLAYVGQLGHCGVYVYDPYAETITFLERQKAMCVRLLCKIAPQHGHVHGGLTTSPM